MITDMCDFYKLNYGSGESKTKKFPFNKRRRAREIQKFCFCISEPRSLYKTKCFYFLRLPPAPPAVFLKGKEIFGFACATGRSAPEARWKCCSRPVGREIKSMRSV